MKYVILAAALVGCIDENRMTEETEDATPDAGVADAAPDALPECNEAAPARCPEGTVEVAFCPAGEDDCERVEPCRGNAVSCTPDVDCQGVPDCPDGTQRQACREGDPGCVAFIECGELITCLDECQQPGLTPPCPDPLSYRAEPCGEDEPTLCRDTEWCGAVYACVDEAEGEPIVTAHCPDGFREGGFGDCAPGDQRCVAMPVDGQSFRCIDARCEQETDVRPGECPAVPGARACFPNEPACGDLTWCGELFRQCIVDEMLCAAPPSCPDDLLDLRELRCEQDEDGICDTGGPCREEDNTCTTFAACGEAVACYDPACADYQPVCPPDTRLATAEERRDCLGADADADRLIPDCFVRTRCDITIVCMPDGA